MLIFDMYKVKVFHMKGNITHSLQKRLILFVVCISHSGLSGYESV